MYWFKGVLVGILTLASVVFMPSSFTEANATTTTTYKPSGEEIAGVSFRFGDGHWGRGYGRHYGHYGPYRSGYRFPGYYRHGYRHHGFYGPYRSGYRFPGYYNSYYYNNPDWGWYGRPRSGLFFRIN
jgi:hypothetical protein